MTVQGHPVLGHVCPILRTGMKEELLAPSHRRRPSQETFPDGDGKTMLNSRLMAWCEFSPPGVSGKGQNSPRSHMDLARSPASGCGCCWVQAHNVWEEDVSPSRLRAKWGRAQDRSQDPSVPAGEHCPPLGGSNGK